MPVWQRFLICDLKTSISNHFQSICFLTCMEVNFLINSDVGIFHQVMFSLSQVKDILLVENSFLENDLKAVSP